MATITGLNMIKSVFAALGAKTSDSSYAVPLVSKTTAEPKGYMDMASLASVLGENNYNVITSNTDLDTLFGDVGKPLTLYIIASQSVASSLVNKPVNMTSGAAFLVFTGYTGSNTANRYRTQILIYQSSIYIRYKGASDTWSSWNEINTTVML